MPESDEDQDIPRLRKILSANVRALIDDARQSRPELGAIAKVAEFHSKRTHGSGRLSKSKVGRIVKGSHPTDIDSLGDLADVFGVQPWQLLVENLNPKALPRLVEPSFLSQIKQIVDSATAASREVSASLTDEQQVQPATGSAKVGPAIEEATRAVGKKNAGRESAKAPKQKGRGRD
jgi:hypothetical protein